MMSYGRLLALVLGVVSVAPVAAGPGDGSAGLAKLAHQRRDAARRTFEVTWANYRDRLASGDSIYRWSLRWLEAERYLSRHPADEVAAFKAHLERMSDLEKLILRVRRSGQATIDEISAAEFYRTEAEIWLLEEKEKQD